MKVKFDIEKIFKISKKNLLQIYLFFHHLLVINWQKKKSNISKFHSIRNQSKFIIPETISTRASLIENWNRIIRSPRNNVNSPSSVLQRTFTCHYLFRCFITTVMPRCIVRLTSCDRICDNIGKLLFKTQRIGRRINRWTVRPDMFALRKVETTSICTLHEHFSFRHRSKVHGGKLIFRTWFIKVWK